MLTKELANFKSDKVEETGKEALDLLKHYKKALIIRPTGFGKSYLLAHISTLFDYTCYVYPRDIIKSEVQSKYKDILNKDKIKFLSYQGIAAYYKKHNTTDGLLPKVEGNLLIILDEVHFCRAKKWSIAIDNLLSVYEEAYLLGATATPFRPDGEEFKYSLFDGHEVSRYTITDAINDKIYENPLYVFSISELGEVVNNRRNEIKNSSTVSEQQRSELMNTLNKFILEHGIFVDNAEIIQKHCMTEFPDLSYLKFIVFYPSYEIMYSKIDQVRSWFIEAFPDREINVIVVDKHHRSNIKTIQELSPRDNTIDLIMSIDMLSYGVHIDKINGIVMLRNTCSDIIYAQQIGRALSIDNDRSSIIFDFVGNLNRRQYYGGYTVLESARKNTGDDSWIDFARVVRSIDNTSDIRELDRITNISYMREEKMWIEAVLYKHCPIELAMERLGILTKEDMDRVIARYR